VVSDGKNCAARIFLVGIVLHAESGEALAAAFEPVMRATIELHQFAAYFHLGMTHLRKGAFAEAIAELQRATTLSPNVTDYKGGLGYAYARAGKPAEARKMLDELKERSRRS
jgi:Flp pilus assembly protein TadD